MKKSLTFSILFLFIILFSFGPVKAEACALDVSIINQDPYPATPGEYVKLVFQIDGVQNPECGKVSFEVKENYPFSLDPNTENRISFDAGTYSRTFSSFYLATYNVRVDKDALNGDNPIEVIYGAKGNLNLLKEFNIYVEDTKAEFEVYVKNYDYTTKELTLEILNTEDVDIEALTIEIPKQDNINIKGSNRVVVGDLDSNEYTTADFEATLPEGESTITLNVIYTDSINVRRTIQKEVVFDSVYFEGRNGNGFPWFWVLVIIGLGGWYFWKRHKKKKKLHEQRRHEMSSKK